MPKTKKISASIRVSVNLGNGLENREGKIWCIFCNVELDFTQKSSVDIHSKGAKHLKHKGDPRWIVEERPDATNVNNWHWTEKNAQTWSKEKLSNLLLDCKLDNTVGECQITEIEKCEGDSSANNRKAKIIVFYEWDLKLKYKGKVFGNNTELTGSIKIPNLSDENDVDDLDIQFKANGTTPEDLKLKEALRHEGVKVLKTQFQKYIDALQEEFTHGMILPKKDGTIPPTDSKVIKMSSGFDKCCINTKKLAEAGSESKLNFQTLTTSSSMKCTAEELYRALTHKYEFKVFTNGSGTVDGKVGGKFEMFNGNVHGTILDLVPYKKIVQEWRFKTWPENHYSKVTIKIDQKETSTTIFVTQTGVPEDDLEKTKEGWQRYYFDAMKRTLGFGTFIQ